MKKISFNIPTVKDLSRWVKIIKFKLSGGFSCKHCGTKMNFRHVQFISFAEGQRFIFSNNTKNICPECTAKEINDNPKTVFNIRHICDWCNTEQQTATFIRHDNIESFVIFGKHWWNGHHICQRCFNEAILNRRELTSNIFQHVDGRYYPVNELGVVIKNEHNIS